ncbi:MAG: hypothetical protein R3330_09375, partial [Saprospiraceae bacterium]|nr:hypothetical protein [Saprospiraceae bacterium]
NSTTSNIQMLADALDIESSGLTLSAGKGERIIFGCSSRIRHTLAPDGSSLTFATKGDLINHWLCCISLDINRDWMWDALKNTSFEIRRTKKFSAASQNEYTDAPAGTINLVRTASFESLDNPQRNASRILFIDAVEPKAARPGGSGDPDFPDTIDMSYRVLTQFKAGHGATQDDPLDLSVVLPITTPPSQVPKIASAGIALSPYVRNDRYSATETRKRHLWIEFEERIEDPQDTVFARVLTVAPDQLLSNNHPALLEAPSEPALPIDPELIRSIQEGDANDLAGLDAMQPMEKSTDSDLHYLLPLPPGLHANADEMFGFFTYEFRVGHYQKPAANGQEPEMVWTTAQGRFGRRLRVTGVQHPAPALTCMPNRDEDKLWVTAPYAVAVHQGKNVTADPPRTELWCLLYAQVRTADNEDYRNVLLDDRQLDWRIQVSSKRDDNLLEAYSDEELTILNNYILRNYKYDLNIGQIRSALKLVDTSKSNKDATKYGTAVWSHTEVLQFLDHLCLPANAPLSVLVVETLPQITRLTEHVSGLSNLKTARELERFIPTDELQTFWSIADDLRKSQSSDNDQTASPLSDELGHHRILRTSPLTEVPGICCPDC